MRAVKFCKVEEPVARMLAKVPRPVEVMFPPLAEVKKRLVVDAVVEKRLVVVALDEVELTAVKFWRVVEPTTRRSPDELMVVVAVPPILNWLPVKVEEKSEVVVASVVVDRFARKPPVKVEEAVEMKPLKKPRVVEVETPQDCGVQANVPPPTLESSTSQPKTPPLQVK